MASSATAVSHPVPVQMPASPNLNLHHPTPDLQSLQGAYVGNIERLEDHAERMSEHGSDLGEEIRKLQLEQKLSDSRRSSLLSTATIEDSARPPTTRSRNASTSSYTNSILDVNGAARVGGYSPGGYITSPVGSLRSASISHQSVHQRQRSGSRASRLGQVVHTEDNVGEAHASVENPGSPQSHTSKPRSPPLTSHRSVSSFTRQYDQIAQEIRDDLRQNVGQGQDSDSKQHLHHDAQYTQHLSPHDAPDRPPTAASTDTTHQARTLWHDFDGAHCPDTVPEEEPTLSQGGGSRQSALLKLGADMPKHGIPPPDEGMVFYPAPVPRTLNLPKRLSKVPAANVQARRRTQLLQSMEAENRKSNLWQPDVGEEPPKKSRKSRQSLAHLPPQLRASAYFDQVAPAQEFEVIGESAQETLESILEASAHAPVSAFTDHPFAGQVGDEVYGKEKHIRPASKAIELDTADARKSRSSLNLLNTRRISSGDALNRLRKHDSSTDLKRLTVRATDSRMSLGDELDEPDREARDPDTEHDTTPTRLSHDGEHIRPANDVAEEEEEYEEEEEEEEEEEDADDVQNFGPPTTLLAELQLRKQQQKSRNLTAATAFPNGMHSTLLELDAVAEVERNKRRGQKVNLAWEAAPPIRAEDDGSDDDVPLGVLYPGRDGLVNKRAGAGQQQHTDWDRPLGLMAQRELEDNEPLSRRRTRLIGVDTSRVRDLSPGNRHTLFDPSQSQQHLAVPTSTTPQQESDEDEGETLAQRIRRLKDQQALDDAIGLDVRKSTISGDFASEMMSTFGMTENERSKPTPSPAQGGDETLGQRRARLQVEALSRGDVNPLGSRPPLRASMSMADVLSAHPIDTTNTARKVSDEALLSSLPRGSLLHQNAVRQSRLEAERIDRNRRISSYGALNQAFQADVGAKMQMHRERMIGMSTPQSVPSPFIQPLYAPMGMPPAMSTMNLPGQRNSFFPQTNMGGMGMVPSGFGYPGGNMMPPQMMAFNMGMNYPYSQMMADPPMDPRQRDMIDRWRSGVS